MTFDPIVEETRDLRNRLFEACDNDLSLLIRRLRAAESKDRERLVTIQDIPKQPAVPPGHAEK